MFETQLAYHTDGWPPEDLVYSMHEISQMGFDGIEVTWSVAESYADRIDVFMEMLHDEGLELAAIDSPLWLLTPDSKEDEKERFMAMGRFAAAVGAQVIVLMAPRKWPDMAISGEEWKTVVDFANELGSELNELGIRLAFHPEIDTWIDTRTEIEDFLKHTAKESVGLCLDTAQMTHNRINPANFYLRFAPRVYHLHLKDYSRNRQSYPKRLKPLGKGSVDFKALVKALDKKDYSGWVVGELDLPHDKKLNPGGYAKTAHDYSIQTLDLGL
ncbi:MAG: sugar phosphate isomerase/epimerase [Planctomycetes bacterium]|nr:sugar phosphate isomerase/epimerase [Planctomycetota bacterium]